MLLPNNYAIFQSCDSPIHTVRSVQSCFEEHEDALQDHLWLAQSPDLNIIKPLVSFREQGEKQIPSIISQATRRRVVQYSTTDFRQMVAQLHVNKEMCIIHRCIHYFCPSPVYAAKINSLGEQMNYVSL